MMIVLFLNNMMMCHTRKTHYAEGAVVVMIVW